MEVIKFKLELVFCSGTYYNSKEILLNRRVLLKSAFIVKQVI